MVSKFKSTFEIDRQVYKKYKKFCKKNGFVMSKRIEGFMKKDLTEILVGLPKVRF